MIQDEYSAKLYALEYHEILGLLMERVEGCSVRQNCHGIKYATAPRIDN